MIEQIEPTKEQPEEKPKFTFRDMGKCFYILLSKIPPSMWKSPNGPAQLPPSTMVVSRAHLNSLPDDIAEKFQIDIAETDDKEFIRISIKKKRKRGQIFKPRKKLVLPPGVN
jgi:hypothetical protein